MKFGSYAPDLPAWGHDGLVLARNVYPSAAGYRPFKGLSAATASLGAAWKGGWTGEHNGTAIMLGATSAKLRSHASGAWSDEYTVATSGPWFFSQFGDTVIGTHGGAPVKYTVSTSTGAALGGSPPSASFSWIVRDFVCLAGDASAANRVTNSAINNSEGWTVGTSQCDFQDLPDGGPIKGAAGGDYGLIFQLGQIWVQEYVGTPLIFTYRKIKDDLGAVTHGSIAKAGSRTFFLSRRGFCMLQDFQETMIGENRVDDTFSALYTTSDLEASMRVSIDPKRSVVTWSMPDRLWHYNWDTDQWSDTVIAGLVGITTGMTASLTIEDVATSYPSIEDATPTLDDAFWRGGDPLLMLFKTDFIGYTFESGDNLEATIQLPRIEMFKGRNANVYSARIDGDMTAATLHLDGSRTIAGSQTRTTSTDFRANGDLPIRAEGRYIQPTVVLGAAASWSFAFGLELEGTPGGRH